MVHRRASPVKHPEKVDMVIFRENTEDIYAGIDFEAGKEQALKIARVPQRRISRRSSRRSVSAKRPKCVGIGIKPVSKTGTERLVRAAIEYAITQKRKSRDLRPQGQHHEVHRRRVSRLGATSSAKREFGARGDRRRSVVQNSRRQTRLRAS